VFIIKWDNVAISWDTNIYWSYTINTLPKSTTLIIKWNVTITWNITPNKNLAIVVKGWDLNIKGGVTKLKWTYIVIWQGKEIKWENSPEKLVIEGSLYWNVNDLISNRTYVDWSLDSEGSIDVWTILDFDSSLYDEPAPLLSKFLDEYFNASRVAN